MRKFYMKTLGILCLSLFTSAISAQTTYYVKTNGTGNAATATSWATAAKDLQDVINTAVSGDKIFVASGTYLPNRPANALTVIDATNRDNAFVLKNGVSIYGGFAGTEASEADRVAGNITTLSGDLNGDDVEETTSNAATYMAQSKTDNVYHVVLAIDITNSTIFDGFTVTKGEATSTTASPISVNLKDIDKRLGGGFYILSSNNQLQLSDIKVLINRAHGDGDANGSSGAGFYINNSSPIISNCDISKSYNSTNTPKTTGSNYGAGMSIALASNPTITNTVFSENFANYGGAVAINGGSALIAYPSFVNCIFKNNNARGRGGAVDIRASIATFTACLFSENTGGAVYNYSGRATLTNNIFNKNVYATSNGTAYGSSAGSYGATFINNTFYDNRNNHGGTADYSTGIFVNSAGTSTNYLDNKTHLYNNIFFAGAAQYKANKNIIDLFFYNTALIGELKNNIIQQTAYVDSDASNKSNVNPSFISTSITNIGFLAPNASSPAKDAGDDSRNTTTLDFNGRARKSGTIDIGAVEYYAILPVSFISFTAKATNVGTQLNWKVASETNNKQFVISRSLNGKDYDLVANVRGAGNSTTLLNYSYTDKTDVQGTYYYKLEQEDLDGTINYLATQVVKVRFGDNGVVVFPNPTKGKVTIAVTAGAYTRYNVIALQGNTLLNGNIGSRDQQIGLNLEGLPAGTYLIRLTGANGGSEVSRLIKL